MQGAGRPCRTVTESQETFAGCGQTLQDSSGKFSHQPSRGQSQLCQWRISATHGEKIVLNLTQLDLPASYNCQMDYLEVRDGYYIKSPLLGTGCGGVMVIVVISIVA